MGQRMGPLFVAGSVKLDYVSGVLVDAYRPRVADHADLGVDQRSGHRATAGAIRAEPEMAWPGLRGDQGDRHPIADIAALEVGIDQERVFVDRSQCTGARRRAYHDGS